MGSQFLHTPSGLRTACSVCGWAVALMAQRCVAGFPHYRLAIFYVFCSDAQVFARAAARGKATGRVVPVPGTTATLLPLFQSLPATVAAPPADCPRP